MSRNEADRIFVQTICKNLDIPYLESADFISGAATLADGLVCSAVFVDASSVAEFSHFEKYLLASLPAGGISRDSFHLILNDLSRNLPEIKSPALIGHILKRPPNNIEEAALLYASTVLSLGREISGLRGMLKTGTRIKRHQLARSSEKKMVTKAILKIAKMAGFSDRIAQKVAVSVDEVVMNAIFDAPPLSHRLKKGKILRDADFALNGEAIVDISIGFDGTYLGILIGDNFGTLTREAILQHLLRDPDVSSSLHLPDLPNSGLGLAMVLKSGCSLSFTCEAGSRSEVALLYEVRKLNRALKNGFQFLALRLS